ncbi:interleukin-33 [Microcebus murinus]|uniref:Interleukin-33 n=1 Tax=Microcebus murinus TaxID=30608 RepID=A0A8C5V2J8_MICMU|nr:interleukin-33 [Microcebus murinus]XP_012593674.1 interleukin-33 [Microcebus murinus]XP_012593685.1 interleukin-33 [Microcebus murinus]
MKPKMKYSTKKISVAKLNSTANKALVKPYELIKSQQKTEEVCHLYSMELRSGLTIEKRACYIRKRTSKRPSLGKNPPQTGGKESLSFTAYRQQSTVEHFAFGVPEIQRHTKRFHVPRTTGISPITESFASLSTYNDQSITFVLEDGSYEIYIEDLKKDDKKEKVLLRYYESQRSSSESGDDVDGKMLMVNLGPPTKDHWLHANNKEHSVELHKSEKPLPEQAFFVLHKQPFKSVSSECVSFECKNYPGTYLGVKDNQLALIKVDCSESLSSENIMFKLSKT